MVWAPRRLRSIGGIIREIWYCSGGPLQNWWVGHPEISVREKARRKQGWYDWDEGYSTYDEVLSLLEAADARR